MLLEIYEKFTLGNIDRKGVNALLHQSRPEINRQRRYCTVATCHVNMESRKMINYLTFEHRNVVVQNVKNLPDVVCHMIKGIAIVIRQETEVEQEKNSIS
jgi:hypothetical protein